MPHRAHERMMRRNESDSTNESVMRAACPCAQGCQSAQGQFLDEHTSLGTHS